MYAGTKWCGSGNIAKNPDDLGHFADTDACCRTHDQCDDIIEATQTKYNLTNPTFYTRLIRTYDNSKNYSLTFFLIESVDLIFLRSDSNRVHCSCDEKFYDCLHRSEDKAGGQIGTVYFSLLNTQCFRRDYPILGCKHLTK